MNKIEIDHIGIATKSINDSKDFWLLLGFKEGKRSIVEQQGVEVQYLESGNDTSIELLQPLADSTPVGKFLLKNGPGIQQLAITVNNLQEKISELKKNGIKIINEEPSVGADGRLISFIHPHSTGGILVELVQKDKLNNIQNDKK